MTDYPRMLYKMHEGQLRTREVLDIDEQLRATREGWRDAPPYETHPTKEQPVAILEAGVASRWASHDATQYEQAYKACKTLDRGAAQPLFALEPEYKKMRTCMKAYEDYVTWKSGHVMDNFSERYLKPAAATIANEVDRRGVELYSRGLRVPDGVLSAQHLPYPIHPWRYLMDVMQTRKVAEMDMDELMVSAGLVEIAKGHFAAHGLEEPGWIATRMRALRGEVKRRIEEELARAEAELEALKEKEEKRNELKAKVAKLKEQVGDTA